MGGVDQNPEKVVILRRDYEGRRTKDVGRGTKDEGRRTWDEGRGTWGKLNLGFGILSF